MQRQLDSTIVTQFHKNSGMDYVRETSAAKYNLTETGLR
jgi:hypothetical protein